MSGYSQDMEEAQTEIVEDGGGRVVSLNHPGRVHYSLVTSEGQCHPQAEEVVSHYFLEDCVNSKVWESCSCVCFEIAFWVFFASLSLSYLFVWLFIINFITYRFILSLICLHLFIHLLMFYFSCILSSLSHFRLYTFSLLFLSTLPTFTHTTLITSKPHSVTLHQKSKLTLMYAY